jgi:ParB/RepB/Spo0J family partition protein
MPDSSTLPGLAPIAGDADSRSVNLHSLHAWPLNPRRHKASPEADAELEDSIVQLGILQTLLVRPHAKHKDGWEIIAGARRFTAAQSAAKKKRLPENFLVPVRVINVSDDDGILIAATENLQREDMPPLDEAELFQAMFDVYQKAGEKDPAQAVASRLKKSRKTIFNRLRLLRCAPEVQEALAEKKIGLGQAEALALGDTKEQRRLLGDVIEEGIAPSDIKRTVTEDKLEAKNAQFNLADYQGEILEDDDGARYFADEKAAQKLQEQALETKRDALATKWPWAKIVDYNDHYQYETAAGAKSDARAGAIIYTDYSGRVVVKEGVLTRKDAEALARDRARNSAAEARQAKQGKAPVRHYTEAQTVEIRRAKTMALRSALLDHPRIALALTVFAMMNGDEAIDLKPQPSPQPYADGLAYSEADAGKRRPGLQTIADLTGAKLPALEKNQAEANDPFSWDGDHELPAFDALLKKSEKDLLQLLTVLATRLVSVHENYSERGPGDVDKTIAIAAAIGAEKRIAAYWRPSEDYIRAMRRDAREILARGLGLTGRSGFDVTGSIFHNLKSAEQVAAIVAHGKKNPGAFKPELFPALRFADAKAMAQLHAAPKAASPSQAKPAKKAAAKAKAKKPAAKKAKRKS